MSPTNLARGWNAAAASTIENGTSDTGRARTSRWTLARRLSMIFLLTGLLGAVLAAVEAFALSSMNRATNTSLVTLDPAQIEIQGLIRTVDLEQAAVRTYLLSGSAPLLVDYTTAPQSLSQQATSLRQLIDGYPSLRIDLDNTLDAELIWRQQWAEPSIDLRRTNSTPSAALSNQLLQRTNEASVVTADANQLASDASAITAAATGSLNDARTRLEIISLVVLALLIAAAASIFFGLRHWVARPISLLDQEVRAVSEGDLRRDLETGGTPEISGLASSVDAMRDRILAQLDTVQAARNALAAQAEELKRANADLDRFADVASHDLQEPLRKVAGFSDLLIQRYGDRLDDRGLEFVRYAADGARRMQKLIDDLLSFARVSRTNVRFREIALGDALEAARRRLSEPIATTNAKLTVLNELPTIIGDPTLLTTLFECLISNSLAYRSVRPLEITVSSEIRGDLVRVTFADNGEGIQPEYAERVFGIFQRLNHDDPTKTGLGLALCRRIIEVHEGRIWVDTGRFDGASLLFELPLVLDTEPFMATVDSDQDYNRRRSDTA